jgi:hypothetical protein
MEYSEKTTDLPQVTRINIDAISVYPLFLFAAFSCHILEIKNVYVCMHHDPV